jgi:hypothetical protein
VPDRCAITSAITPRKITRYGRACRESREIDLPRESAYDSHPMAGHPL